MGGKYFIRNDCCLYLHIYFAKVKNFHRGYEKNQKQFCLIQLFTTFATQKGKDARVIEWTGLEIRRTVFIVPWV